jgi:hypothetical protein
MPVTQEVTMWKLGSRTAVTGLVMFPLGTVNTCTREDEGRGNGKWHEATEEARRSQQGRRWMLGRQVNNL